MTFEEARAILGISADIEPDEAVRKLTDARERLAEMVRTAPTDKLSEQFQVELERFDQAMAALREDAERRRQEKLAAVMALVPGSISGSTVKSKREGFLNEPTPPKQTTTHVVPHELVKPAASAPAPKLVPEAVAAAPVAPVPVVPATDPSPVEEAPRKGAKGRFLVYALLFMLIGGAGGGWLYRKMEEERQLRISNEVMLLERLGGDLVRNRRWEDATNAYLRIEELIPGSETAQNGRDAIEEGMKEEQEQFVGYWSGEAQAAFEADRLDDALSAAEKVLERYPNDESVLALSKKITSARQSALRNSLSLKVREAIEAGDWAAAEAAVSDMANEIPGDELITVLATEIKVGKEKEAENIARARELAVSAKLRDPGKFDAQVLEWMREAIALAPRDPEVREIYEKIASYSRTLHVPTDVKTIEEALRNVRPKDRIVLEEGTFEGGVVINVPIQLEGAGDGSSVLESTATDAPAVTFGPGSTGSVVTGISFQCKGFDASDKRYPAVQVRGGEVEFSDCDFKDASGNGLEVIEGGQATAAQCDFESNGWDGFAARGSGSRLVATECRSTGNFAHGFEIWDGATATIESCEVKKNSRNGILVDSVTDGVVLTGNTVNNNREYGILLSAGAAGKVSENKCSYNRLGGMLVRFAAMSLMVQRNTLEGNEGDGLILEQGLRPDTYETNRLKSNDGRDLRQNVQFVADH